MLEGFQTLTLAHRIAQHEPGSTSHPAQPLRVGFSGLFLGSPQTGTGRYARRVLEQLGQASGIEPVVFSDRPLQQARSDTPPGIGVVRAPAGPSRVPDSLRKVFWEQLGIDFAARRLHVDVLYSPHFSLPLLAQKPMVVSIHDLIPLTEPAYLQSRYWRLYFKLVIAAAHRAKAINTLSFHARGEIERMLGIPRSRIHVIPPGIEPHFNAQDDPVATQRAVQRLQLPTHYLLYVGGSVAHKNIGVLFEALARLASSDSQLLIPPLVVAAPIPAHGPTASTPDWRGMADRLGVTQRVHFVERIAEEDLPAVYRGALAFLFPSRSEGFGMTPLEAMACGTPVICSNATSLPEAVGDAALLVPPDDPLAWAQAIERMGADESLRTSLRTRGLTRAASLTWEDTGARVLDVIREAATCAS